MNKVTEIEACGFEGCSSLSSITLPNTLTIIGESAFEGTSKLKGITIPSSVKSIGASAFQASGLVSITIPKTVKEMRSNYGAFEDCKSLKTATISAQIEEIPYNLFKGCSSLTTVTFTPECTATTCDYYTFTDCTSLTSVTLPQNLTNISSNAFNGCTSLKNIVIPDTVTKIGYRAFRNCKNLLSIHIPYGVKEIDSYAFEGSSLINVYFTKSIQDIDRDAFYGIPTSRLTIYGYTGSAAKYFAQEKGYKFVECTPVLSIKITGANSVLKKSSIKLSAIVNPTYAYNKNVAWKSSNTSIATVDSNGIVTGKGKGSVVITATAKDGTAIEAKYTINVKVTELPYKDVTVDDWYYNVVKYTYQNGLMSGVGTTGTEFAPNESLSRGMLVTILWRMENTPIIKTGSKFSDVKNGTWYYNSINWAASKGIVSGKGNGKFEPDASITREELAVIMRNYCNYKKKYVASNISLSKYTDRNNVSSWATTAVQWAVKNSIISGKNNGTRLDPKGNTTRAEAAAIITNYLTNIK